MLFRLLTGDRVLRASVEGAAPDATLRTYAFCATGGGGGVVVLSINLDPDAAAHVEFDPALGTRSLPLRPLFVQRGLKSTLCT